MNGFSLFLDEDSCDWDLVEALRRRDVDVSTALENQLQGASDRDQLIWARTSGRVLYTFNARHFCQLHREFLKSAQEHAGILIGQQQRFGIGEQLRRILRIRSAKTGAQMRNGIEFLSNWN